ncbi:MAG: DUF502 domain-containing protein [Chromatiales bacterium]|jgi:uncharacterized membrane protein
MEKIKAVIRTSLVGGLVVILPVAILVFVFRWIFRMITDAIQPLTDQAVAIYGVPEFAGDIIVVSIIVLCCFLVGVIVKTSIGRYMHRFFDERLQKLAPGYRMIKEVVVQIFGNKEDSPFSNGQVARVKLFGPDCPTEVTALVTDKGDNGIYTVFMPTGPNPTSGNIYHVMESQITLCPDVKIDSAMRTVIACGAGSASIFDWKKA